MRDWGPCVADLLITVKPIILKLLDVLGLVG